MNISVYIHPGSKKGPLLTQEIDMRGKTIYHAWIRERPIDGQANDALIVLLANFFSIARSHVEIIHGHISRHKIVSISL